MATSEQNQNNLQQEQKGKQGFASMDPERQKEIASEGGKSSHAGSTPNNGYEDEQESSGQSNTQSGGTQGGSPEQHREAGRQSHKNSD